MFCVFAPTSLSASEDSTSSVIVLQCSALHEENRQRQQRPIKVVGKTEDSTAHMTEETSSHSITWHMQPTDPGCKSSRLPFEVVACSNCIVTKPEVKARAHSKKTSMPPATALSLLVIFAFFWVLEDSTSSVTVWQSRALQEVEYNTSRFTIHKRPEGW